MPTRRNLGFSSAALIALALAGCNTTPPPARELGIERAELVTLVSYTQDQMAVYAEGEGTYYWRGRSDMLPPDAVFIWQDDEISTTPAVGTQVLPRPRTEAVLLGTVYFGTNSAVLTPKARKALDELPESHRLSIVSGHADVRGPDRINDPLSERRANAVADYLRARGTLVGNVTWHGSRQPEPTLQKSRRAEMWKETE